MISNGVMISLYTLLVSIVTFPIMIFILMKIKRKVKISPFLLGLLVYFTFGVFSTTIVHTLFINEGRPTYAFLTGNVIAYSLYYAVVVGILEEFGFLIAYKKIIASYDENETPITLALGNAWLEVIMVCFLALAAYIAYATKYNEVGEEGFREFYGDIENLDLDATINMLKSITVGEIIMLALQRIAYFFMHIFLSIMVFYSVKKNIIQYFWMAVIIRGLCTVPGAIENFNNKNKDYIMSIGQKVPLTLYLIVIIAFAGFIAIKLYKAYDAEKVLYPADLFKKQPDMHLM